MAEKKMKAENLSLGSIQDMLTLAEDIKKFIKENKLFQNIQGKEYVNVEGWMYCGSRLGLTSYCKHVKDLSTEGEIKYSACVVVENIETGRRVGQGFAVCSNKEQGKKYYQEYAIVSMAQTRGVSKAYRLFLAQLIRMAGFEPTPAEEMDGYDTNTETKVARKADGPVQLHVEKVKPAKKAEAVVAGGENPIAAAGTDAKTHAQETPAQIKYASATQKEEIIRHLNNPVITRQEKTKMLLNINRLDEERAAQAIEKLKKVIEEREEGVPAAGND